jgi:hypothetical protein
MQGTEGTSGCTGTSDEILRCSRFDLSVYLSYKSASDKKAAELEKISAYNTDRKAQIEQAAAIPGKLIAEEPKQG